MASRYGANLITIKKPWGNVFSHEEIKTALEAHKPKVMGIIHAETSTGTYCSVKYQEIYPNKEI
jgi:alanine-glyoxylate transaminase/serine-glyoxylate transaminase/serine-pyruvate transaminase